MMTTQMTWHAKDTYNMMWHDMKGNLVYQRREDSLVVIVTVTKLELSTFVKIILSSI